MTKILLVEDDKSLREIYGVRLLAEGYDIISAGDGEEALAVAIKDRPSLIVSDVMMPKISGFDMLDILRSTTETRDIKVIMMTALSSEDQRKRGEALGADRYLIKSQVGIEDVVRTVHEVLGDAPSAIPTFVQAATPATTTPSSYTPERSSYGETSPVNVPNRDTPQPVSMPEPVAPAPMPQPVSMPEPVAQAPAPIPQPMPEPESNPLPQPTAPFSTPRPSGLGDRIIQPLERQQSELSVPTFADQMSQELGINSAAAPSPSSPEPEAQHAYAPTPPSPYSAPAPDTPSMSPPVNTQPQAPADNVYADEANLAAHLNFEQTPRAQDLNPGPATQPSQAPPIN